MYEAAFIRGAVIAGLMNEAEVAASVEEAINACIIQLGTVR